MEYETILFYATQILLWGAVIFFLFSFVRKWKERPRAPFAWTYDRMFALACLLFIFFAYTSSLWAPDPLLARQHALWILEAFLLFFLLALGAIPKEKVWFWFAAGSVAPAALGIYQFLAQTTFASTLLGMTAHPSWEAGSSIIDAGHFGRWLRAYGPFAHPNIFGGYLVAAIIATDQLLFKKNKPYVSCFMFHVSCLQWCALFFTFSRAAWLAAIVWTFVSIKHKTWILKHVAYRVSLIAILAVLFFPLIQTRITGGTTAEIRSKTERVSGYREAIAVWQTQPLIGVGAGNYTIAEQKAFPRSKPWEYQPVHNVLLLILAELGLIGVALTVLLLVAFFRLSIVNSQLSIVVLPLLLFDHYLWSSHAGLLLLPIFSLLTLSTVAPQDIPNTSLDTPSPE